MKHYAFRTIRWLQYCAKGLSLGIRKDDPAHPAVQIQEEGINFFIEGDDEWFFDGHNLSVTLNEGDDFPQFNYENKNVASATLLFFLIPHISHTTQDITFK